MILEAIKEPIAIALEHLNAERFGSADSQCCSMYRGRTSSVFCLRRSGHDGPHRGDRVQWTVRGLMR